jgi:hypothetical protein
MTTLNPNMTRTTMEPTMRELTDTEIDAISGAEGCRAATLGDYLVFAVQAIGNRIGELLGGSGGGTDPWA